MQANAAGVAAVKDALQDAGVATDQAGGQLLQGCRKVLEEFLPLLWCSKMLQIPFEFLVSSSDISGRLMA